jgi:cysteine-rich repeat protein
VKASGTECRVAAGACDVAESCDGTSTSCPTDGVKASGTECRASAGACDLAENCDGTSPACPTDAVKTAGTECRASTGVCDLAEICDGSSGVCPTDVFQASGTECRAASGACDLPESCTGASGDCPVDALAPAGTTCRAAADACDAEETCTGTGSDCPADLGAPDGTSCSDGLSCTLDDVCTSGVCGGTPSGCGDGVVAAGCSETCDDGNTDSGDGCSATCQVEPCPATARLDCIAAGEANFAYNEVQPGKERATFAWGKAATETNQSTFGDPVNGNTSMWMCLYGDDGALMRSFVVDRAGDTCGDVACWKARGKNGYAYSDKAGAAAGIQSMTLLGGPAGRGKVRASARNIPPDRTALATSVVPLLKGKTNLTMQFVASGASCLSATLDEVKIDDGFVYQASKRTR